MTGSTVYRCQECGLAAAKPGTCPDCAREGRYLALVEERRVDHGGHRSLRGSASWTGCWAAAWCAAR